MLINFIYDFLLICLAMVSLPTLLYQWIFHKKYRQSLPQRLGIGFPKIEKGEKKLIWVHAVSLGETKAVSTIVKRIRKNHPDALVVTSSVTETGFAEAKKNMPDADYHVFLPLDFLWIVRPIIDQVKPDIVILCETDFWFNFLQRCKKQGADIFLVNGKLSKRSLQKYKKFSWFSDRLFTMIDLFCVQSEHYQERFLDLGINKEKLIITGNIKFDSSYPAMTLQELNEWKKKLGIPEDNLVLVAGSTHNPEEKMILDALEEVWKKIPNITLVLVPRHPERFDEVAALLDKKGILYNRFAQIHKKKEGAKIILMDAMGLLRQCYQLADIAIVAGSYTTKVGGHNIIEPAAYGVPVIYGPYMHTQPELVELVQRYQAGLQVNCEQLVAHLTTLFNDPSEREKIGKSGTLMIQELQGAADKTYQTIFQRKKTL
jgi:3-deoxy-D-manno-octulosonic-acid transferase